MPINVLRFSSLDIIRNTVVSNKKEITDFLNKLTNIAIGPACPACKVSKCLCLICYKNQAVTEISKLKYIII